MSDPTKPRDVQWPPTADLKGGDQRQVVNAAELIKLPQRLGKYVLEERLGAGGMAEVFLATQEGQSGFKKKVVIKRIHNHLAQDERFVTMFRREATTVARLHHANVVQVFELGDHEGLHYIAMEYIDGLSLNRLARRAWKHERSMPTELIIGAMADAALGLHHAHTHKDDEGNPMPIVHRDISPENLMMGADGITKVLDFGIARGGGASNTKTGEIKGKMPFMAPEQIRGDELDPRLDLYALGVTMYWLLTGQLPLEAASELLLLNEILATKPAAPSTINEKVPAFLDDLCMALLEKNPARRPQSALAIYEVLHPLAPARMILAAPYLEEILDLPDTGPEDQDGRHTSGFIPSMPETDDLQLQWSKATPGTPFRMPPEEVDDDVYVDEDGLGFADADLLPTPLMQRPAVLAAAGGVLLLLLLIGVFALGGDDEVERPDAGPVPVEPPVDPPVEPTVPPVVDPPVVPVVDPPVVDPPVEPVKVEPKKPTKRSHRTKAPKGVQWLDSRGRKIGSGSGTIELFPSVRSVTAYDPSRGVKTLMSVAGGLDYSSLPSGKLGVRALPYAEVFLGKKRLGMTPFKPQSVTVGKYRVKLVFEDKVEYRTIEVKKGQEARVTIDFRGK